MTKLDGWAITPAGIEALDSYPDPQELYTEVSRRYREIDQRRKQAQLKLSDVHQYIAAVLQLVEPGSWTAHDDLAQLADASPGEIADFLASGKVRMDNAYRVLHADGSVPDEGMLNAAYRGTDMRQRLAQEGVEFDALGRAAQDQRLTADALMELLDTRRDSEAETVTPARRAWMVRGTSVDGYNLVPDWLGEGYVSLSASQLPVLDAAVTSEDLRQAVETAYEHKSYAYRGQRLEEFDRFIRRMREGDLVLTPMQGKVYIGEVASEPYFVHAATIDNLRRNVRWYNEADGIDGGELRAPIPALLQSQAYVVDLTEAYDDLAALVPRSAESAPAVREIEKEPWWRSRQNFRRSWRSSPRARTTGRGRRRDG